MLPRVSIIIPVYNVKGDLFQSCILSVMGQTYENIEIIIVNDGSTDRTLELCREFASRDARITIIDQSNQGVSAARNNGTQRAQGDYVFYADGDDILAPDAIREGVENALKTDADVVIAAIEKISAHEDFKPTKASNIRVECLTEEGLDKLRKHYIALDDPMFTKIQGRGYINRGSYCRLIKRELAIANPFPGGLPIGEDLIWNMSLLNRSKTVCVVYHSWYGYLVNDPSAIRRYYGNRREKVEEYLQRLWNENRAFCEENLATYGKNVAVEFYCMLRFDLMSPKCVLTPKEKNAYVQRTLARKPWSVLKNREVKRALSGKHKVFLLFCRLNLWQFALAHM